MCIAWSLGDLVFLQIFGNNGHVTSRNLVLHDTPLMMKCREEQVHNDAKKAILRHYRFVPDISSFKTCHMKLDFIKQDFY